jgi:hypothetical protein
MKTKTKWRESYESFFKQLRKLCGDKPLPHYTLTTSYKHYTVCWGNDIVQLEIDFTERDDIEHILRYTNFAQPELSFADYTFSPYTVWKILGKMKL